MLLAQKDCYSLTRYSLKIKDEFNETMIGLHSYELPQWAVEHIPVVIALALPRAIAVGRGERFVQLGLDHQP